jgi:hypothetical protein
MSVVLLTIEPGQKLPGSFIGLWNIQICKSFGTGCVIGVSILTVSRAGSEKSESFYGIHRCRKM